MTVIGNHQNSIAKYFGTDISWNEVKRHLTEVSSKCSFRALFKGDQKGSYKGYYKGALGL